jgi:SAM-dependent methyltransferase
VGGHADAPVRAHAHAAELDLLAMAEAYQQTAILAATVRTGLADALALAPRTASELAQECQASVRGVQALLGALHSLGLAVREDARFALSESGAPLARAHPQTVAAIVEKEWFFYGAWGSLEQSVRDGHARIPPWRERLRRRREQSLDFLRALDDLAMRFGAELAALAPPLGPGRLLDVGGGAGSHSAYLAGAVEGLQATVLDLPEVGGLVAERHPELQFVAGDLESPRFGLPPGESFDVVLLANVLHDHPPERARWIVAQASELLCAGGTLLVYEWVLDASRDSPPAVARFALMMMVENEGGASYTRAEIEGWLSDASLREISMRRGSGPIAVLSGRRS